MILERVRLDRNVWGECLFRESVVDRGKAAVAAVAIPSQIYRYRMWLYFSMNTSAAG